MVFLGNIVMPLALTTFDVVMKHKPLWPTFTEAFICSTFVCAILLYLPLSLSYK